MAVGIICGMGEVGKALMHVLASTHSILGVDVHNNHLSVHSPVDVLHICFPYSGSFEESVKAYQEQFKPKYTLIHSTVPVGVSTSLHCYHSPIRGIHPYLAESIRTFVTYLAPRCPELQNYLEQAGMVVQAVCSSDDTEAGKLWSLAKYAWDIMFEKEVWRYCEEKGLDWRVVYRNFTESYNSGYIDMDMENYTRPVLEHMEGPIGGHCVIPAVEKLGGESGLMKIILEQNRRY